MPTSSILWKKLGKETNMNCENNKTSVHMLQKGSAIQLKETGGNFGSIDKWYILATQNGPYLVCNEISFSTGGLS